MPRLARFRSFFLPASIGLLLVVAGGWYSLVWLPTQHKYLDDRNFRLLETLSEQIRSSIDNFDKMMDNASDSGVKNKKLLDSYLRNVAPQLRVVEHDEETQVIRGDYGDPPKMAVRADEGTHFLYLAFSRGSTKYAVQTDLDRMIVKLLPPAERSPFDVVLVAQSNGAVIFQKSSQGLDVARIDTLENAAGDPKTANSDAIDVKSLAKSSKFSQINLAGRHYRLYSQPVQLSLPRIEAAKKAKERAVAPAPEYWILCGLVREEAFRSESQSISYTYVLWFSAAILLLLAIYPFLRLYVSSAAERLRPADIVVTAIFSCVAAATLTFLLLDVYYWRNDFVQPAIKEMHDLAAAIDENFAAEKTAALEQLDEFNQSDSLGTSLLRKGPPYNRPLFQNRDGECIPLSACRTEIHIAKQGDRAGSPSRYPYVEHASWSDATGMQRVKWTIRRRVTPFINLDDPSVPYYSAVKSALRDPTAGKSVPTVGIGSQYSSNTGDYITVFWKLIDLDSNGRLLPGTAEAHEAGSTTFCASLVTRPISVVDPVLSGGFQFAVIKPDGTVVFHSDSTRNLRENFFAETDQQQEVRSRVLMRAEGWLVANYLGRGHRLYLRPMASNQGELWTVVVFRDLRLEETINLEILSLASLIFLCYALLGALVVVLVRFIRGARAGRSWLWPDSRKTGKYRWLVVVNGVAAMALLVLSPLLPLTFSLLCAVLLPAATLTCNLVSLTSGAEEPRSGNTIDQPSGWQLGYTTTLSMLVVVVAVLPCLSFFRVACDFEHKFLVERSQLQTAADIDRRAQGVRNRYQGVNLGAQANQVLADPKESAKPDSPQQLQPYFWYWQGLPGTEIVSSSDPSFATIPCSTGSADRLQRCLELWLGKFSPLYNQFSADVRYLAEASSDTWSKTASSSETAFRAWTWSSLSSAKGEKLMLVRLEPEGKAWTITTPWAPFELPWGHFGWWAGMLIFLTGLIGLIHSTVQRIFLLDIVRKCKAAVPARWSDPAGLIADLPSNLLLIGPDDSPTIAGLIRREGDVQKYDIRQILDPPPQQARSVGGPTVLVNPSGDPIEAIVKDGRKAVFYRIESGLGDPAADQRQLAILQSVISRLPQSLIVISSVDPLAKSCDDEREQWRMLLRSFVRIDLNSIPIPCASKAERKQDFESEILINACCQALFSERPRSQKLVLVQLAQEKLVSPNSGPVVCQLFSEGLLVCCHGMMAIKDSHFANFLTSAISRRIITKWERLGAGIHSGTLRTSLLVVGLAVAGFLLYTQGAIFNTWVTYATGLAAAIPAFLRILDLFHQGSNAQAR
jgi:hypothetical protein